MDKCRARVYNKRKDSEYMAKIELIGLGQGGATCVIKLAEQGFEVCIFEKALQDEAGYESRKGTMRKKLVKWTKKYNALNK